MIAYHNNPELKARVLKLLAWHREQDRIVKGQYWWRGQGCAVGCTLESIKKIEGLRGIEHGQHALYERYLGVPAELAHIEDDLFESLGEERSIAWPERFASAIPVGADLSLVVPRFLHSLLTDPDGGVQRGAIGNAAVTEAVRAVAALFTRWLEGDKPTANEFRAAHAAASAAAWAAESAAERAAARAAERAAASAAARAAASATGSAAANAAAWAAASAAARAAENATASAAAWEAAWAAASAAAWAAAWAAARAAERTRQADKLIELMAAAPVSFPVSTTAIQTEMSNGR